MAAIVEAIEEMMEIGEQAGDSLISEVTGALLDEREKGQGAP